MSNMKDVIRNEAINEVLATLEHSIETITYWYRGNGKHLSNLEMTELKDEMIEFMESKLTQIDIE